MHVHSVSVNGNQYYWFSKSWVMAENRNKHVIFPCPLGSMCVINLPGKFYLDQAQSFGYHQTLMIRGKPFPDCFLALALPKACGQLTRFSLTWRKMNGMIASQKCNFKYLRISLVCFCTSKSWRGMSEKTLLEVAILSLIRNPYLLMRIHEKCSMESCLLDSV